MMQLLITIMASNFRKTDWFCEMKWYVILLASSLCLYVDIQET